MRARVIPLVPKPRGPTERAFLPAALEIVETPASPTLRLTAGLIALFLTSALVWSYVGRVDIIATAPGKVVTRGRTKVVQPYETGVVRAIRVADGDRVEPGQSLIELDPTMSSADRTRYADTLVQARLDQARLKALLNPAEAGAFAGVGAPDSLVAAAQARLEAEQREQAAKLAKLDHEAAQKHAEQAEIKAHIAKIDAALPLVRERAAIREEGLKSGYGNKLDLLTQKQQVVEDEHERVALQRKHDEAEAALAELAALRNQAEAEFRRNALLSGCRARAPARLASRLPAVAQRRPERPHRTGRRDARASTSKVSAADGLNDHATVPDSPHPGSLWPSPRLIPSQFGLALWMRSPPWLPRSASARQEHRRW